MTKLKMLAAGATEGPVTELVPEFTRASGHEVELAIRHRRRAEGPLRRRREGRRDRAVDRGAGGAGEGRPLRSRQPRRVRPRLLRRRDPRRHADAEHFDAGDIQEGAARTPARWRRPIRRRAARPASISPSCWSAWASPTR